MFGKLREKLKSALNVFSRKAEEEAEEKKLPPLEAATSPEEDQKLRRVEEVLEEVGGEAAKAEEEAKEGKKEEPEEAKEEATEKEEKIEGVKIIYFVHGTTTDNEEDKATGWNPGELSELGIKQAKGLGKLVAGKDFDAVFCSDLKRAVDSASLGFRRRYKILQDERLRECNYGDWNGRKKDWGIIDYVEKKYPSGESYKDVEIRVAKFLNYLLENFKGKRIAFVAHQGPQLAMDVLLKGKTWKEAIEEDWRNKKAWQPGWEYELKEKIEISEEPKKSFFQKIFSTKKEKKEEVTEEIRAVKEGKKAEGSKGEKKAEKPEEAKEEKGAGEAGEKKSFLGRVKQSFTTKTISGEKFEELFWELELVLLENNVSVEVIQKIKEDLKDELVEKPLPRDVAGKIRDTLKKTITEIVRLQQPDMIREIEIRKMEKTKGTEAFGQAGTGTRKPYVIAFFGINGSGKTTSIAKLARHLQKHNKSMVFAACDTFRAAAIQQLGEHAKALGVKMIKQDYGADAAAVAFDAVKYAEKNGVDVVLIDTAGRLHSNVNLMQELDKIIRVAKPDLKIFVGESITGNDCIEQARRFNELTQLDGCILTKADVDEKGGAPLSIAYTIKKPILFLGTGQGYDDLEEFDAERIVERVGL